MAGKGTGVRIALAATVVLAAAGGFVYFRLQSAQRGAAELTAPPVQRDLPVQEIRQKLKKGSFRDKLAAKKQIQKLEPADRLAVLRALLKDDRVPTRMIAVGALAGLESAEARAELTRVSKDDADEGVRAAAKEKLAAAASSAPAAGAAGDGQ